MAAMRDEYAVHERQFRHAVVSAIARQVGRFVNGQPVRRLSGSRVNATPLSFSKTVAAGHDVDQVQRLDCSLGNLANEAGCVDLGLG